MLRHHLLTALRYLRRHPLYTALTVGGLAVAAAAALLLGLYVGYERSYDAFHADADRVFRVRYDLYRDGSLAHRVATTFPAVGPAAQEAFPEVEAFARVITRFGGGAVRYGDAVFHEERVYHADASFFEVFSYPFVAGDPAGALVRPGTAVLSTVAARKYFGAADPIGQRIRFNDEEYAVTGVVESPEHSHLRFDFLFSYPSLVPVWGEEVYSSWTWYDFYTYLRLRPGADPRAVEAGLPGLVARHRGARPGERLAFTLQPLTSIHLHSDLLFEARANGSATTVRALTAVAVLILVLAWANYLNLSLARAAERLGEVAVRRALGAERGQLAGQALTEALLVNAAAAGLAVALAAAALPAFNDLAGTALSLSGRPALWAVFVGVFAAGAVASGWYPSAVLASLRPAPARGRLPGPGGGARLRRGLVVLQFTVSMALIAAALVVHEQLRYVQARDLGIDVDRTVVVRTPAGAGRGAPDRLESVKERLRRSPYVQAAAVSSEVPGGAPWLNTAQRVGGAVGGAAGGEVPLYVIAVDTDYLAAFGPRVVGGRLLSAAHPSDRTDAVVLNEEAVRVLGFAGAEAALGQAVRVRRDTLTVVGVVADHHQRSLVEARSQIAYRSLPEELGFLSVRFEPGEAERALGALEEAYRAAFPDAPFAFSFLDEAFEAQYREHRRAGTVFRLFAGLAILIAAVGLFGLAAFAAQRRTREVGIRKALGASVASLVLLLSGEFARLVAVALALGAPLAYVAVERWLEGFAYRAEVGVGVFAAAGALVAGVALLAVSYHAVRAATADPVRALRQE